MEHPPLLLPRFFSDDLCRELIFIHRSCCTLGCRPFVFSTTLPHLIATNSAHLLLPFVSIRETLPERWRSSLATSTSFSLNSLYSWCKGLSIGWHSDENRPYLKQRHFAAVCYLNSCGKDFQGGDFQFQDGEAKTVVPMAGDVLTYTADSRNANSVDEIIAGERSTLTLWFSFDRKHDEDAKRLMLFILKSIDQPGKYTRLLLPFASTRRHVPVLYGFFFRPMEGL